jgi:hypothetical protein
MVKRKVMLKILNVFINKCKAAGRYGEDDCLFNAKLVFGVFLSINLVTILFFLFKRVLALRLLPSDKKTYIFVAFGFLAIIFTLLTIAYPKRKILAIQLDEQVQKKIFVGMMIYMSMSLILFSISIYTSR